MSDAWVHAEGERRQGRVVGRAVQGLAAARLGRGFIPLGGLFLVGIAELVGVGVSRSRGLVLALGAPATAAAMLSHALRVVELAFGRTSSPRRVLAAGAGIAPPAFGLYVFGWRGLRTLAAGGAFSPASRGPSSSYWGFGSSDRGCNFSSSRDWRS
jgi:hypothetical protein